MNHAEHAEKLLARYHDGQGSDQLAIAHALLAINETLQSAAAEMNVEMPPFDEIETEADRRIAAALALATVWDSNEMGIPERPMLKIAANQLREVLR